MRTTDRDNRKRAFSVKILPINGPPTARKTDFRTSTGSRHLSHTTTQSQLESILTKHYHKPYIQDIVEYHNRQWDAELESILTEKNFLAVSALTL